MFDHLVVFPIILNNVFLDLREGVRDSAVKMVKFLVDLTLNEMRFVHSQQVPFSFLFTD